MGYSFEAPAQAFTTDVGDQLELVGQVTAAIARGESPSSLLRLVLRLIADLTGGSTAALGVTPPQMSALVPALSGSVERTVLGQGAEIVCGGELYELICDWEGAGEPVLLDHDSRLVLPLPEGGLVVLDPAPGVAVDPPTVSVLRILTDLAAGSLRSVCELAEAQRRAAALEDTRRRLREKNSRLREMAVIDELTQVHNRRFFERRVDYELERVGRYGIPVSLLIFDIDHFKSVNDTYGHPVGDEVLRTLSALAKRAVRKVDLVARIGGEEFAVLMPHTEPVGAMQVADRLRQTVAEQALETGQGVVQVTISIGVISVPGGWSGDRAEFITSADNALYDAKRSGRNRVVLGEPRV